MLGMTSCEWHGDSLSRSHSHSALFARPNFFPFCSLFSLETKIRFFLVVRSYAWDFVVLIEPEGGSVEALVLIVFISARRDVILVPEHGDDLTRWRAYIEGPSETPYANAYIF